MALVDIVILEKVTPKLVREAYEEYLSGFAGPANRAPTIDLLTRGRLEVLSRKERLKLLDLELAEKRTSRKESATLARAEADKAKAHSQTIKTIMSRPAPPGAEAPKTESKIKWL